MRSNRTLQLVAGLMTLAAAASAQEKPNWQLYGTLIAFGDRVEATGASTNPLDGNSLVTVSPTATNVPARTRISCSTSNIGFKGDFPLNGEELKLIWQVESSISVDGDQPSVLAGRNSAIGLAGKSWGRVFVGSWDTPYKYPQLFTGAMRGLFAFDSGLTGNPGFNVPGTVTSTGRVSTKNDAAFNRRQGNSIQYWSPELSGFSARVAYSANETKPSTDAPTQVQYAPTVVSALLSYKLGDLTLHYGYEQHKDYFGLSQLSASATLPSLTNAGSKDEGHEFLAFYTLKATGTRFTAMVERLRYTNDETVVGKLSEYERTAWSASVQQVFGPHKVWVTLASANEGTAKLIGPSPATTDRLGAKQLSLGYSLALAKNADLFCSYYQIDNQAAATYGAFPVLSGINPGADTKGFGIGILYTF